MPRDSIDPRYLTKAIEVGVIIINKTCRKKETERM